MPTRFYLSSTETVSQTPEFAAWSRTAEALRRSMSPVKDGSAITSTTIWANGPAAADESALARQFVSAPMAAGIAFSTSDTIKAQVRCMESAVNDNINRSPIAVKVYSEDGTTLRATLLDLGHVGLNTTEWIASTLTNKTIANGDALTANYTTVLGDILVIEMGGQVSAAGGTSVLGTMSFGSASATDLGENETDTAANNPWFEISRTISFATVVTTAAPTALAVSTFAPSLRFTTVSVPATASLTLSGHAPVLRLTIVPPVASLSLVSFALSLNTPVTPSTSAITTSTFAPTVDVTENVVAIPSTASLTVSMLTLVIPSIIFADPGGDAVQTDGYFGVAQGSGTVSFDTSQKRNGVGSWKFDSGVGNGSPTRKVAGVLGQAGRINFYFRYDSVPATNTDFLGFTSGDTAYSGGGFIDGFNLSADDAQYATATPAKNSAQGSILEGFFSQFEVTPDLVIDSIKIVYERSYNTASSIGISRVRWVVGAEEGPNHDNTSMPLGDTVVQVDITADRTWTPADINSMQVIAEALRGDTDTPHTQAWDYVAVQVEYHFSVPILFGRHAVVETLIPLRLDLLPAGSGAVLRFADTDGVSCFDGITIIPANEFHRVAICWIEHGLNDLEVKVYLDAVEELWLVDRNTAFGNAWPDLVYGWIGQPGANKVIRFDQIYIDNVDDLSDPGPRLMTNKSGATVNADNFDTTGGTGAVNERPVSLTNYRQQAASSQVLQNYTLQAADVGDVDISDETYIGYMGWAIAKKGAGTGTGAGLTVNGVTTDVTLQTSAGLLKAGVFDVNYPSNVAGIGMRSIDGDADTFLYECGLIEVYQGPPEDILFAEYLLLVDQSAEVVDDLRAAPPDSYTVRYWIREGGGMVRITGYFITAEGESPREWSITGSRPPGSGVARLDVRCIEMRIVMEVTEADSFVMMQHYFNL